MIRSLHNEKGIVLITTLGVIAVLLVAATQISRLAKTAADRAIKEKAAAAAEQMAWSGIHLGMLILSRDAAENATDSVQEAWADPEKMAEAVSMLGFEDNALTLAITDELGRIQINALLKQFPGNEIRPDQQILLENFFRLSLFSEIEADHPEPLEIVNALKDWMDSNDADAVTGLSGAESGYYQTLETPYSCANGPFNHIRELFNVKGITRDIFSTDIEALLTTAGMDRAPGAGGRYSFPGKININTAPVQVIAALLPEGREQVAADFADFRLEKASDQENFTHRLAPGWFEQIIELSGDEKLAFKQKIRYSSHIYRIMCTAEKHQAKIRMSAVVEREKSAENGRWQCRILQLEKG